MDSTSPNSHKRKREEGPSTPINDAYTSQLPGIISGRGASFAPWPSYHDQFTDDQSERSNSSLPSPLQGLTQSSLSQSYGFLTRDESFGGRNDSVLLSHNLPSLVGTQQGPNSTPIVPSAIPSHQASSGRFSNVVHPMVLRPSSGNNGFSTEAGLNSFYQLGMPTPLPSSPSSSTSITSPTSMTTPSANSSPASLPAIPSPITPAIPTPILIPPQIPNQPPPPPPAPTEAREDDDDEGESTYKIHSLADQPFDENDDRPTKKPHLSADLSPIEKLTSNQYLYLLRQLESRLKTVRANIIQRELGGLAQDLKDLRQQITLYGEEFETLKSKHYLRASDFNNLLSLEEFLTTTLSPQLQLYELDYDQLTNQNQNSSSAPEVPVFLSIVNQETAGPIFKEKAIGPFTLRLLTGATITQIQSGPVQPKLVDTSQRIKRNNSELENAKQNFKENGTATFTDLKFSSGTFPNLVRLKFRVTIQIMVHGQKMTKTIESAPTKPFVSMTNTGSQWKDAAGTWLKEELFQVDTYEVSLARLWNYFQKHYLISTKQELSNIKRPLTMKDFEYLLKCRFRQGTEKPTINQKEFTTFWDWIGPALKKIRYQKYLLWLFENGYLCAFVTAKEAEEQLQNEPPGTFLIRLSERLDGELVISYAHGTGVRHYLVQGDDTADKKKTLVDFLGQNKIFINLLQISQVNGKRIFYRHQKDKVLSKYYKKPQKQSSMVQPLDSNPYDMRLPVDLHSLGL